MEHPAPSSPSLRENLLLLLGVVATVLLALLLALTDTLQIRLPPRPTAAPVAVVTTAAPPTRALPTATPTLPPPPATPTLVVSPTSTPVEVVRRCDVAPEGWIAYTVRRGDTLFRLAIDSGATVSGLMLANCLDSTRLYAGMILFLPAVPLPPPPVCTGPPADWTPYRVQRGDTLYALARAHHTTVGHLVAANCLVNVRIYAGQTLFLPPTEPTPTPQPPTATPRPPQPTNTPRPSATPTTPATATATTTPTPSATTAGPTATSTPAPTSMPTATNTPPPAATATSPPGNTPAPQPTDTPQPADTPTPPPPTATNTPLPPTPTITPLPPTPTNIPLPTVTSTAPAASAPILPAP